MKAKASGRPNKFIRVITIPFRALCKARELYVRAMMDCASGNIVVLKTVSEAPCQRRSSFSVSSARSSDTSEDDFVELVRAASARNVGSRINLDVYLRQEMEMRSGSRVVARRSASAAMGPIDEESPCCYFGEDAAVNGDNNVAVKSEWKSPRRSRSHAVSRIAF